MLVSGCTVKVEDPGGDDGGITPVQGNMITIRDCKADPFMLETTDGSEVTFQNADSVAHTIIIDGEEFPLAAMGTLKVVPKRPENAPSNLDYTDNYNCDGAHSGAIFIPASG